MMLAAWEQFQPAVSTLSLPIPEHGGALPDFLAEVKWELDWLLTTQARRRRRSAQADRAEVRGLRDARGGRLVRYFTPVGTAATADFVAVMAQAARIYRSYDPDFAAKYLAAARLGYAFLDANTGPVVPDTSATFSTGGYGDSNDTDERLWAAAEMWETTGEAAFLADFETRVEQRRAVADSFDWQNVGNLGMFTYLLSKRDGRNPTLVASLTASLKTTADAAGPPARPPTLRSSDRGYYWGSNGAVARTAMNLAVGERAQRADARLLDAIAAARSPARPQSLRSLADHGVGNNPPLHPHHRPSASRQRRRSVARAAGRRSGLSVGRVELLHRAEVRLAGHRRARPT